MPVAGLLGFVGMGLVLGLLGGGGSILAVPVLVNLMDLPAGIAVPMSLPIVGITAAVGAVARWKRGELRLATVAVFTAFAMAASYVAARLGASIPDRPRLIIFGATMLIAAAALWRRGSRAGGGLEPSSGSRPLVLVIPAALVVGALTGVLGVGGGFLIVPALVAVLGLPMPEATATSLAVIALNTVAASAGFFTRHVDIDIHLTAMVIIAALIGMIGGTLLAPRFSSRALARGFAGLLVILAVYMIGKELAH